MTRLVTLLLLLTLTLTLILTAFQLTAAELEGVQGGDEFEANSFEAVRG